LEDSKRISVFPLSSDRGRTGKPLPKSEHLCYTYTVGGEIGDNETQARYDGGRPRRMCRNIKPLFNFSPPATEDEVRAAALQYVRKVSGFTKPSQANEAAFHAAVDEIAAVTATLLSALATSSTPKSREIEAARAKARSLQRFGSQQPAERQVS
jgi:hypothetical protein